MPPGLSRSSRWPCLPMVQSPLVISAMAWILHRTLEEPFSDWPTRCLPLVASFPRRWWEPSPTRINPSIRGKLCSGSWPPPISRQLWCSPSLAAVNCSRGTILQNVSESATSPRGRVCPSRTRSDCTSPVRLIRCHCCS
uniref:GH04850p n=1 Tax=Drosophila melanogaster TaxID=7227 RepID=Q8MRQ6_DROME|nr:GH04850p [Drosophila melanogaster]